MGERVDLSDGQPIFVGFKLDGPLRRQLQALTGPDRAYVSYDDTTFLTICRIGEDEYVGKVIGERLTTDRVDDVKRNVLSILQRVCPDTRFPAILQLIPCRRQGETAGSSS
jgi:hypothetical protein